MFNKSTENWNLDSVLNKIRLRILNTLLEPVNNDKTEFGAVDKYAKAYKEIFVSQNGTNEPSTCSKDEACGHPMWVKRNAFLALKGNSEQKLKKVTGNGDFFY